MTLSHTSPEPSRDITVVVGVSGGVGRALASALLRRHPDTRLVGVGRRPPAPPLEAPDSVFLDADITREDDVARAAEAIDGLGAPSRIVIATGLLHAPDLAPERALRDIRPEALARLFAVNTIGPALIAKHLAPRMPRDRPALIAALSARVGSLSDNRLGGWYGYRASKAALNMMIATLAVELRRTHPLAVCVALHPGTVSTPLSAPFVAGRTGRKTLTPDQSAQALVAVMDSLGPADSGRFLAWDGAPIAW
jgi:NAD(P)-dependent dehydrogenase (short-subunit alcohol dehydrogenase family)